METLRTDYDLKILETYDKQTLRAPPELKGRLERALLIALTGEVKRRSCYWTVRSQTDPEKVYNVTQTDCSCLDSRAPQWQGFKACKHRLACMLQAHAIADLVQP